MQDWSFREISGLIILYLGFKLIEIRAEPGEWMGERIKGENEQKDQKKKLCVNGENTKKVGPSS